MSEFIKLIKENRYHLLDETREGKMPLYIYGSGVYGRCYARLLRENSVPFQGFLVDREYWQEGGILCDDEIIPVFPLDVLLETKEKVQIIVGFYKFQEDMLALVRDYVDRIYLYDFSCLSLFRYTKKYVEEHEREMERVYRLLADEKSRELMVAYINQRISGAIDFCEGYTIAERYFDPELMKFTNHEVFVDCGAYNGDSISGFLNALKRQGIDCWDKIYAMEPDPVNYETLVETLGACPNVEFRRLGAYRAKQKIFFEQGQGKSSCITERGKSFIEVDKIDHVLEGGRATFIKMDIQGAEEDALKGAEETIKKYKPKLAVCLAHRPQDLYLIVEYLDSLNVGYHFYLRMQESKYSDICLIAI